MGLFGQAPSKDPKEQVRKWSSSVRKEQRVLERQIRGIQQQEAKVTKSIKDAAKKGDKDVCKILAKEIVQSRKAVNKIYSAKAHLNSIDMQMKNQLAVVRISGALEKSTQVMQSMQQVIKLPEIRATMMEMSKEMMKAGIIEEMIDDTMESVLDTDELEEEAEGEVEKILFQVTQGAMGKAPAAGEDTLPEHEPIGATAGTTADSDEEEEMDDMKARLEALRS